MVTFFCSRWSVPAVAGLVQAATLRLLRAVTAKGTGRAQFCLGVIGHIRSACFGGALWWWGRYAGLVLAVR
jgi:hypothetical protein